MELDCYNNSLIAEKLYKDSCNNVLYTVHKINTLFYVGLMKKNLGIYLCYVRLPNIDQTIWKL